MRTISMAVITAAGASLCCTGPLLLAGLGVGSLAGFAWLEPTRPYLALAAVGLLGWAFWRSYRPRAVEACCSIEERKGLSLQRKSLWGIASLVLVLLAFPYLQASLGNTEADSSAVINHTPGAQSTWAIAGLTCAGCAAGLEASLAATKGMTACEVLFDGGLMSCRVDDKRLAAAAIPGLVEWLGFQARLEPNINTIVN